VERPDFDEWAVVLFDDPVSWAVEDEMWVIVFCDVPMTDAVTGDTVSAVPAETGIVTEV
jgi:hypothetical protein